MGKGWLQMIRQCLYQCTTMRGSKAMGGSLQEKPTCMLVFALRSRKPMGFICCADSMSCKSGAVQSDWQWINIMLNLVGWIWWAEKAEKCEVKPFYSKIIFKGKKYAMYTFLMQRLSSNGFSDSSIRALATLAPRQCCQSHRTWGVLGFIGCSAKQHRLAWPCWKTADPVQAQVLSSSYSIVATPPCRATALQHGARPQLIRSLFSSSTFLEPTLYLH